VKLRDLAALIDFGVIYNSAADSIMINTAASYTV
jgi:hypothetical protein